MPGLRRVPHAGSQYIPKRLHFHLIWAKNRDDRRPSRGGLQAATPFTRSRLKADILRRTASAKIIVSQLVYGLHMPLRRGVSKARLPQVEMSRQGWKGLLLRHCITLFCLSLLFAHPAQAAQCGGDFRVFIDAISGEAIKAGLSPATVARAFAGVSPDRAVLAFDRRQQSVFNKSFDAYAAIAVTPGA
jgi:transglycosylase-like protein with SLT domain